MTINEVIQRATSDPNFALELQYKASQASQATPGAAEWNDLLFYFAKDPEDLARLTDGMRRVVAGDEGFLMPKSAFTTTTLTTVTTARCLTTTTTTTTTCL